VPSAGAVNGTSTTQGLDGARILLVEDEANVRETLARLLTIEGAQVKTAANGREALDLVASDAFDLLLTDLDLPDVPGDIIIRHVLTLSGGRAQVIVITGAGDADMLRARRAGAQVVLLKPVDWSVLISHVRSALSARFVVTIT
jgi:two-component system response regulator AtoC